MNVQNKKYLDLMNYLVEEGFEFSYIKKVRMDSDEVIALWMYCPPIFKTKRLVDISVLVDTDIWKVDYLGNDVDEIRITLK